MGSATGRRGFQSSAQPERSGAERRAADIAGPANKSYKHVNTTTAGTLISGYTGTILGSVVINTAGTGGGSVLTIYDDTAVSANVVAVVNTQATGIPALEYNLVLSRGLFYALTAGTTTQSDLTITYD